MQKKIFGDMQITKKQKKKFRDQIENESKLECLVDNDIYIYIYIFFFFPLGSKSKGGELKSKNKK